MTAGLPEKGERDPGPMYARPSGCKPSQHLETLWPSTWILLEEGVATGSQSAEPVLPLFIKSGGDLGGYTGPHKSSPLTSSVPWVTCKFLIEMHPSIIRQQWQGNTLPSFMAWTFQHLKGSGRNWSREWRAQDSPGPDLRTTFTHTWHNKAHAAPPPLLRRHGDPPTSFLWSCETEAGRRVLQTSTQSPSLTD